MQFPTNKILVLDIETTSTDTETTNLRYFGAYSYLTNSRYYFKSDSEDTIDLIKDMVSNHDVIVGFNIKRFDNKVLNRYGVFFTGKVLVDLWEVISEPKLDPKTKTRTGGKGRGYYMGLKLNSWSLANIIRALNLGELKKDFDYFLLQKQPGEWTRAEEKIIVDYLHQDITITKMLFEYTNNFFFGLTEHLSLVNINRFNYITSSVASVAYKIICFMADLPEEYDDEAIREWEYEGGYVRYPDKEKCVGEILCLDFKSMYPSIERGFGLFGIAPDDYPEDKVFSGNDFFSVKGRYKNDVLGPIENAIATLYKLRLGYKENKDNREYLIKIIINSIYGITAKPVFKHVYSRHGAEDCTYIGRTMIKHVAETFNKRGFEVLYGDTDSVYVALNNKTREDALSLAQELNLFFKSKMPFPHDDFGLDIDAEIKAMFFFPMGDGTFKKKNYVYISKDDKLNIMGLPIIKSNASRIAVQVLDKYLKPQIIKDKQIKFPLDYLKQIIYYELEQDLSIATQVYKVREREYYKKNPNGLYAQITQQYGAGTKDLITNNKYGVGKDKRYCTLEEFRDNRLSVRDVDLTTTLNNLEPFTKNEQMTLENFE